MVKIEFSTDNEAFQDESKEYAIIGIIQAIATRIHDGVTQGVIHDINGNNIGKWRI
jgi:hypothetical protein